MDPIKKRNIRNWAFLIGTILIVFVLGILATSIIERKYESSYAGLEKKDIKQNDPRNAVWGQQFPQQYESYNGDRRYHLQKHVQRKRYDRRNSRMIQNWSFFGLVTLLPKTTTRVGGTPMPSRMFETVFVREISIQRIPPKDLPGTCWTCKSPDVPRYMAKKELPSFIKRLSKNWVPKLSIQLVVEIATIRKP